MFKVDALQIFNNSQFGKVRTTVIDGEPWFIVNDVCTCLEIKNKRDALTRLDVDEKGVALTDTLGGEQKLNIINEFGLYTLVLTSRKPEAKAFKRWITHEVIPAIRKTGSYSVAIPKTLPDALRAYAAEVEEHNKTKEIVAMQEQQIAEFKPKQDYLDKILSSHAALTITQIASDYNLSAIALNKILNEERIQRKVNEQWILYAEHMGKGYVKSETFLFTRADGRLDSKITTKWTQKGRLLIHDILRNRGINAIQDEMAEDFYN